MLIIDIWVVFGFIGLSVWYIKFINILKFKNNIILIVNEEVISIKDFFFEKVWFIFIEILILEFFVLVILFVFLLVKIFLNIRLLCIVFSGDILEVFFVGIIVDNIIVKNFIIILNIILIKLIFKIGIELNNFVFIYLRNIEDIMVIIYFNNNFSGIVFIFRIKFFKIINFLIWSFDVFK